MKKRLSLLMAALMIITLLPMSSFAAASAVNTTLDIVASAEDAVAEYKNVTVTFKVPKGSTINAGKLRLELDNGAEFRPTDKTQMQTNGNVVLANIGDGANNASVADADVTNPVGNLIFINVKAAPASVVNSSNEGTLTVNVPVYFPNTGDVNLKLTDETNVGFGTLAPVKVAVVKDSVAGLSVSAKDSELVVSFDGGKLSQFEVKNFSNDINAGGSNQRTMEIMLDDDTMKFESSKTKVFVDGKELTLDGTDGAFDGGKITIKHSAIPANAKSMLVLPVVDKMGRKASEGPIKVVVSVINTVPEDPGPPKVPAKRTVVVSDSAVIGKVVDYTVTMTIVEKGKKEMPSVWGGERVNVTVTLKGPKGSILNRSIDFTAEGADVSYVKAPVKLKPATAGYTLDGVADGEVYKDGEFELNKSLPDGVEEVKFDIELRTSYSKDGVATLTAAQRGWEVKADAAKITPKLAVKAEVMPVKKGEARETANVVVTEAKAGLLTKTDKLQLRFDTKRDYTQFTKSAIKAEATNGMKLGDPSFVKGSNYTVIEFPITKSSSGEAAVITFSGIKTMVDGSATDDTVKIFAQLDGNKVANAEYIKVVKEYALESILTVFTIGQTQYTVNGEAKTAASAPYIKNGKTMLPIRALSESLGLTVQWNGQTKTATFTDSTKVAAVTIGAEKMFVNGTPIPLAAKAELVNGTTFVELRSLATAFGVQIDWDAAAKTATVSK